jgi:DNA-binding Lrp family transcriptional regulator
MSFKNLFHDTPWTPDEIEQKIIDLLTEKIELSISDIARELGYADNKSVISYRCRRLTFLGFLKMRGDQNKRMVSLCERRL